ncbi:2bee58ee-68e3-4ef4-b72e-cfb7ab717c3f [Sclerotinia trifoliorum]|uniref:2bee58ee-68e3-4ef4-b72e-cfb7ab717c3f n=1 Tax=Sclerotinia trifoliorum TaxID=28548 RepID=A0A8H2ZMN2_9HELO|nr:2bee58ee-68e3-4ef4-b72e-cfb7ab717c3f [Sclerotinia trifoliorum]
MFKLCVVVMTAVLSLTSAKTCTNITIPISINARNGIFSIPTLSDAIAVTKFAQDFLRNGQNYSASTLSGFTTVTGQYNIAATVCVPSKASNYSSTWQFLTHGVGYDRTYWDLPFDNHNYSYVDVAVDQYGYSTLAIDRLGIGESSKADPTSIIQAPAELSAIIEVTKLLRAGSLPDVIISKPNKLVHVGHSFGSILSYGLVSAHPEITDGLILQGFSIDSSALAQTIAGFNIQSASVNQPYKFGPPSFEPLFDAALSLLQSALSKIGSFYIAGSNQNNGNIYAQDLPNGYITWANLGSNQFAFLAPPYYDPAIAEYTEEHKEPFTTGEILTIAGQPSSAPEFTGPVLVLTGNEDQIFCGGNCSETGSANSAPNIPAQAAVVFPKARTFVPYVQPRCGHAVNVHFNSSGAYKVMNEFLREQGF